MSIDQITFSDMEIDAIGEIMNISLGSSVTSISTMLDKRVNITTPTVSISDVKDFGFESYEPAIGVEINYISGLNGVNVMILKESDIKVIVGLLLGVDFSEQEFVMDEMNTSAVCEIMNQMMGASATALSSFLGYRVDISPPASFPIDDSLDFKKKYFDGLGNIVAVSFRLIVDDLINSEFVSVMHLDFAKDLVKTFLHLDEAADDEPIQTEEPNTQSVASQSPQAEINVKAVSAQREQPSEEMPRHVVEKPNLKKFDVSNAKLSPAQSNNLNLIMSVPLQITVEIGQTRRKIKEILEMTQGTIIELDKQAGSQVDILVNNQVVAKGDVVIVDDYYGVRVTDIVSGEDILEIIK